MNKERSKWYFTYH